MISREVVIRDGEPVWRICSGGVCVECRSGTQAAAVITAFETSHGLPPVRRECLGKPQRGPDMVPDPGV